MRGVHLVRDDGILLAGVVVDGVLSDLMAERIDDRVRPGDIYLGRVDRTVRGSGSAFVDIGLDQPAFLSDAGTDASAAPLVQVVRAARDGKSIEVTRDIALPGTKLVYRPLGAGISVSRKLDPGLAKARIETVRGVGYVLRAAP